MARQTINKYSETNHKVQTATPPDLVEKDTLSEFYCPLSCKYRSIKFHIIISRLEILNLSFSDKNHRKALKQIKQLMPETKLSLPANGIDYAKKLVKQILVSDDEKPLPDFNHNLFLKNGTPFQQKIWQLMSHIEAGSTTTYGELATAAGSPGGARAVGHACNQNPLAIIIPCHRVIAANGPGGFAGSLATKLELLEIDKMQIKGLDIMLSEIECTVATI